MLELVKAKLMKELKMLAIKSNSRNKSKVIKMNNKTKTQTQAKNNKMIFKCKVTLKGICTPNNNNQKEKMIKRKANKSRQTRRWAMWIISNESRISKMTKEELRDLNKQTYK